MPTKHIELFKQQFKHVKPSHDKLVAYRIGEKPCLRWIVVFIGAGSIHIQPYDKSAPLLPIGNVSEFNFSFGEDREELKNYIGGGGNRNVISRVSGITVNLIAHDFTASNISLALRGSVTAASITAATDAAQKTYGVAGELIPFQRLPDLSQAITVKDSLDTILVEGDDYQLMKSGIQVIEGGGC